jgi:hypothetical protein
MTPMVALSLVFGLSAAVGRVGGQQRPANVATVPFPSDPGVDIDAKVLAEWDPKVAKEMANMPGKDFKWPGALPRPGSTKIFENEWLIIFDDDMSPDGGWHRHIREAVSIGIRPGRISELFMNGVLNIGEAGMTTGQLPSISRFGTGGNSTTVGHAEWSTDPDRRRRAIYIEFKGTEVAGCGAWSSLAGCE